MKYVKIIKKEDEKRFTIIQILSFFITPLVAMLIWDSLAPIYLPFLPSPYLLIPYWHWFGIVFFISLFQD
jgi:hypothetical protein